MKVILLLGGSTAGKSSLGKAMEEKHGWIFRSGDDRKRSILYIL